MAKKVLFVLNAAGGGASQGIYEYLRYAQGQIEAYVVIPHSPNDNQRALLKQYCRDFFVLPMPWWNIPNGLPLHYRILVYLRGLLSSGFRRNTTQALSRIIEDHKIDIVYTGSILTVEGALAAKATGRDHYWHIKETFGRRGRVQFPLSDRRLQSFILSHSRKVVVMTDYIKSFFTHFPQHEKLRIVNDGIDPSLYEGAESRGQQLREKVGIAQDEIVFGMVASLSSIWKNHQVFIEAAARLREHKKLRFVAFGPEPKKYASSAYNAPYRYYEALKKMVADAQLEDQFIWAGFCPDIPAIFSAIDTFVHPCETEPFGRVVIEAMAAGCPVLVPSEGGAQEPVKHGHNGLKYRAGSAEDMAAHMLEVARHETLRKELGQNAREYVSNSSYTLREYSKSMNEIFENQRS